MQGGTRVVRLGCHAVLLPRLYDTVAGTYINGTSFNLGTAPTSDWKVMTGTETVGGTTYQTLNLMAVPEPSAQSLLAFGMAALVAVRSLRKKNS